MELKAGMKREQVEKQVAVILGRENTYSAYGNNLLGGTTQYRDGDWVLAVTYKADAISYMIKDNQGRAGCYPPIDETLLDYKIFRGTPDHSADFEDKK